MIRYSPLGRLSPRMGGRAHESRDELLALAGGEIDLYESEGTGHGLAHVPYRLRPGLVGPHQHHAPVGEGHRLGGRGLVLELHGDPDLNGEGLRDNKARHPVGDPIDQLFGKVEPARELPSQAAKVAVTSSVPNAVKPRDARTSRVKPIHLSPMLNQLKAGARLWHQPAGHSRVPRLPTHRR